MTNANGREMLEAIRQFSHFYKDCALLLKTGEAAFMGANWKNIVGNTAIANVSKSIDWPEYWPPYYAFRYFKNSQYPSLIAFLSIIFDLPEEPAQITEPLISAGLVDYGENAVGSWEYWYATLHAWTPNRQDNGMVHVMEPHKEPANSYKFSSMKTLAVPLISISGAQDLKDKVIQPLFNEISKSMPEIKKGSNQ